MNMKLWTTSSFIFTQDLLGRKVFSKKDGMEIGIIEDVMIEPDLIEVAAILTSNGNSAKQDLNIIPYGEMNIQDQGPIEINQGDQTPKNIELHECKKWLSVSNQLIGQEVVTKRGIQIGEIEDLVIDEKGRVLRYELRRDGHSTPTGYEGKIHHIPSMATHFLAPNVLRINHNDLAWIME